jgi:hypothetical protein
MPVSLDWTPQPAEPGTWRAELSWTGDPGTSSTLASALRGWLHLLWFEVSLVFGTLLLVRAHGATRIAASAIYVASVCGMFGISALYHRGIWSASWRQRLQRLDHAMIFFLIAGSLLLGFLGTVAGLWARRWDHYAALLAYFLVPFSYLSGMFYSTLGLPELARQLIALNPLYYVIDGMRYGMTGYAETAIGPGALLILVLDLALAGLVYGLLRSGWRLKA